LLKSSIIIGTIILTSTIATATPVKAGDRNCDRYPDDPLCTGEEGAAGMVFCDLHGLERGDDCYDRDFSRIDCEEKPNHSRCVGHDGRDGYIFCDVAYADLGYKPSCYDRNDEPTIYCDNYAKEESDKKWEAEFCQSICDNYENVIGKGEPCEN
jgi:hypothetical protein